MSKINPIVKSTTVDTENRLAGGMGAFAAKQDNVSLLRRVVLANLLWEDNAYVDGVTTANQIKELIPKCPAEQVYNIAREARLVQKLRHTPLFIAVEMCKYEETRKYVARLLPEIITRADMLTDFLALYWKENGQGKAIANCAKNGLAEAFHNFNEYKLAKYDRDAAVKLRDVMFLCHPKARNEYEQELFKKVADRTLKTPDTWEVALSGGADKKETWERLITEGKLGGMAMLRNLSNMKKASVDKKTIYEGLNNLNGTMLLPLDFLKAARMAPEFTSQISDAMVNSYKNLPKLPGKTLFIVDVSGSMGHITSSGTSFSRLDQAAAMAMLAANQCEDFELVLTAGSDSQRKGKHEWIQYPKKGFDLCQTIGERLNHWSPYYLGGGGIFTRQCLEWCKDKFKDMEFYRIIVFSDSQDCDYPDKRVPNPFAKNNYIVDVSAHQHGVNYNGKWTAEISGWSEHFLTYIAAFEGIENTFEE